MNFLNKSLAAFLMLFVCLFAVPRQQFYDLGDFRLESGKVLEECRIGYRTCGKLNENKDNIILFPTWFGGTSEHIWSLVDTYGFIDTSDYYIVITDALANGISTSPSNSRRQGGKVFPQVEISDMARVAYSVVKDHLGFDRIHAIVGGSMGSMQGFELISLYPDFADKAVLYVSSPRETAYDIMIQE